MLTLTTLKMLENEEGRAKAARIAAQKARTTGIQPPRTPIPYPNPTSKAKLRSQTEKTRLSNQRKIRCAKNEKEWAKRREDDAKAKKTREAGHPAHTRARGKSEAKPSNLELFPGGQDGLLEVATQAAGALRRVQPAQGRRHRRCSRGLPDPSLHPHTDLNP